jgi:FkbM family methyltransferase
MRPRLLVNPRLLCERLADASRRLRRMAKLKQTSAKGLSLGHIDSLELLELSKALIIETIYDVGANVGTWTLLAKSVFPHATVDAFEPLPNHQKNFEINVESVLGTKLHCIALGAENTTGDLRVTDFSDASSFLPLADAGRNQFRLEEIATHSTEIRKLDDYQTEAQIALPDLIKLDVQGFELEVLKGAVKCLKTTKAVIIEMSFKEYYVGQCQFHEIVGFLAHFGLFIQAFGINTPLGEKLGQTDVLFMRAC